MITYIFLTLLAEMMTYTQLWSNVLFVLLCDCSGFINGGQIVGNSVAVAAIMFIVGCLFALLATVCFILLLRVCRDYNHDAQFFTWIVYLFLSM